MNLKSEKDTSWDQAPWWGEYLAQYREVTKYCLGARILDVGCGFGLGSRALFDNGAVEVTGIDIDEDQISFARKNFGRDGVNFKVQWAENMDFPAKSFDIVTCFQILEKSSNPDAIIHNIARVLDKNGVALISTVNRSRFSKLNDAPVEKAHVIEFDQTEFRDIIRRHFGNVELAGLYCTREQDYKILKNQLTEKIPHFVRNLVSQKIFGQTYFPSEREFVLKKINSSLSNESIEAPLFYVTCKKT